MITLIRIYRVTIAVLVILILGRRTRALQQFELTCLPSSSTREAIVLLHALHVYYDVIYKGLGKITILKIMCLERFVLKGCVFLAPAERRARTRDSPNLSIEHNVFKMSACAISPSIQENITSLSTASSPKALILILALLTSTVHMAVKLF